MYADAADVMDRTNLDVREVGKMSVIEMLPYPTALEKSMYVCICMQIHGAAVCMYIHRNYLQITYLCCNEKIVLGGLEVIINKLFCS